MKKSVYLKFSIKINMLQNYLLFSHYRDSHFWQHKTENERKTLFGKTFDSLLSVCTLNKQIEIAYDVQ